MKTPPFLLGATLLFWGWQSDLPVAGLLMGLVLESARWVKVRWDLTTRDFERIWTFCALLFLAGAVIAFTSNDGPSAFSSYFQNPTIAGSHTAGTATSRAAAAWIRWQPLFFFLFLAAQTFHCGEGVPVETVSLLLRFRWKRQRGPGAPEISGRTVNVSYPYFGLCLLAASAHTSETQGFFWGLAVLLAWALWPVGSPRYSRPVWAATLAAALALGFCGQRGLNHLQHYIENLNPQWPFHFSHLGTDPLQSRTALGRVGQLKLSGRIVIRLEVKAGTPPAYLREASYRSFRTQVWHSEATTNDFSQVLEQTNAAAYVLVPGKSNSATASIACPLPGGSGLLPLPSGCGQINNRLLYTVEKSPLGAVLVEGPGLVVFDAHYGPGATLDGPLAPGDLAPGLETNALDQVLAELHAEGQSREETLRSLQAFFQSRFSYSTWQGLTPRLGGTNDTPLSRFLLHTHSGHCEYFATAGVLLLRRLNIPARYAVGYAVHEHKGRNYVVRQRDGHAWCLVWNPGTNTWEDFDPTPPSWMEAEAARASLFEPLSDLWSRVVFEFSKFRWGESRVREYVLWGLLPVLALLLYQILFRSQRRRHQTGGARAGVLAEWPGSDSEFYLLEAKVRERGLPRAPDEPLSPWLARAAADPALADLQGPLQTLLRLHYRLRFDPLGLSPAEREALRREATSCLASLGNPKSEGRRPTRCARATARREEGRKPKSEAA